MRHGGAIALLVAGLFMVVVGVAALAYTLMTGRPLLFDPFRRRDGLDGADRREQLWLRRVHLGGSAALAAAGVLVCVSAFIG